MAAQRLMIVRFKMAVLVARFIARVTAAITVF